MLNKFDSLRKYRKTLNGLVVTHQEGEIMQPGSYSDLSNEDYHNSDGLSASGVKLVLDTPYKYYYEYLSGKHEEDETERRSLIIGQAVHTLALEPDSFPERFAKRPDDIDRRTKDGKERYVQFEADAKGKVILTGAEWQQAQDMAQSIRQNKGFNNIINGDLTFVEQSVYWIDPDTKALLKSRPDFYNHFMVLDIKTTISAKPADFEKAIFNYGYHRQAAMALDALTQLTGWEYKNFVILAVEKKPPYLTALYLLDKNAIEQGRREYKRAARTYQECKQTNIWPAYPDKVIDISLPNWAITN